MQKTEKITIWLVGDSTVSSFHDLYFYPRFGWGTKLEEFFDSEFITVRNLALSGRSSLSFTHEENYQILLGGMKEGDFLFVSFGHNDEKMEVSRFTSPVGDEKTEGSFAHSLYFHYILPAKEKKCQTILCTPIVRRPEDNIWRSENLHRTEKNGSYQGGDYSEVIRSLGKRLGIFVVDMTTLTKELYETMGAEQTLFLHAWNSSKAISVDNTHTNEWGAYYNAYLIAKTIFEAGIKGFSSYIKESMITHAPSKEILKVNPEYKEVAFHSNLKQSEFWEDYGCLKGTVFGSVGENGIIEKENFILEKTKKGTLRIAVKNNKGKITLTEDGLAMYYVKIPSDAVFTLSATVKINRMELNDQVSFGLMARDEIYIDQWLAQGLGDYVAAAPLKFTQMEGGTAWNNFARKSGVLTKGGTLSKVYHEEDFVKLILKGTKDGYSCQIGEEEAISGGFDFKLTTIDAKNQYVGMFASRNCDVEFFDISLLVDDKKWV